MKDKSDETCCIIKKSHYEGLSLMIGTFILSSLKAGFGMIRVLYFCVDFWKLSHLTRDLSQAEKKINIVSISLEMAEVVILSENSCHFVSCST